MPETKLHFAGDSGWNGDQMLSRAILYFDEVAKHRSMRSASDRLHIAASAIDRQILLLEREIQTPLFNRSPQGLTLTSAGEILVCAVRQSRVDLLKTARRINHLRTLQEGTISVGLVEGANYAFNETIRSFLGRFPNIKFVIRTDGAPAIIAALLDGACDVGYVFNPPVTPTLRVYASQVFDLMLIVPPSHRLATRSSVHLKECASERLVLPDVHLSLRRVIDDIWVNALGHHPESFAEGSTKEVVKLMVAQGLGITVLPTIDALEEIRIGRLVAIPFPEAQASASVLSLVVASNRTLSHGVSQFVKSAVSVFPNIMSNKQQDAHCQLR